MKTQSGDFMTDAGALLGELVSIPSINPCFQKSGQSDDLFGEERVAAFLEVWATKAGLDVQRQPVLEGRSNVLIRLDGGPRHLVWEAHMDTVQVDNMTIAPFEGEMRDGRLYGRGSCDTKGSLCAMMLALRALAQEPDRPTITLAATVDEEFLYQGVTGLLNSGFKADGGVVGEPTELHLVIAHKGCIRFSITTRGHSVHSSRAEEGINAIEHMSHLVSELSTRAKERFTARTHPLVGTPTLSVTLIEGGVGVNTVPHRCEIKVDRRVNPGETPESAMAEIRELVSEVTASHPELQVEVYDPFVTDIPMEVPADADIVAAMRTGAANAGLDARVAGVPYGSDASKLVRGGIPTIVFGPGSIAAAHTEDESVALHEVAAAVRTLIAGAQSFAGSKASAG